MELNTPLKIKKDIVEQLKSIIVSKKINKVLLHIGGSMINIRDPNIQIFLFEGHKSLAIMDPQDGDCPINHKYALDIDLNDLYALDYKNKTLILYVN